MPVKLREKSLLTYIHFKFACCTLRTIFRSCTLRAGYAEQIKYVNVLLHDSLKDDNDIQRQSK